MRLETDMAKPATGTSSQKEHAQGMMNMTQALFSANT